MGFVSAGVQGGTGDEDDEGEGGSDSEDEVGHWKAHAPLHVCLYSSSSGAFSHFILKLKPFTISVP